MPSRCAQRMSVLLHVKAVHLSLRDVTHMEEACELARDASLSRSANCGEKRPGLRKRGGVVVVIEDEQEMRQKKKQTNP